MKIAVLTKAIPSYESSIRIDSSSKWIDESVVNFVVNESDSYALEEALQIKEKLDNGSEVVVVTMGSQDNTSNFPLNWSRIKIFQAIKLRKIERLSPAYQLSFIACFFILFNLLHYKIRTNIAL